MATRRYAARVKNRDIATKLRTNAQLAQEQLLGETSVETLPGIAAYIPGARSGLDLALPRRVKRGSANSSDSHEARFPMRRQRLDLPLRGLAGEGAQAVVDRAIGTLPGVLSAKAGAATAILRIEYDADAVSPQAIHDALAQAGVSHVAKPSHADVSARSDSAKDE